MLGNGLGVQDVLGLEREVSGVVVLEQQGVAFPLDY